MFKYHTLARAVCYVISLLLLIAGIESVSQGGFCSPLTWSSPIAVILFCVAVILLLSLRLLWRARSQREKLPQDIVQSLPEIVCIIGGGSLKQWNSNFETALAIIGVDIDGVITSWNRAVEKLSGYPIAEAVGRELTFLLPSERQSEMERS